MNKSRCVFALLLFACSLNQSYAADIIRREGWSYDDVYFQETPEAIAKAKKDPDHIRLQGWADYRIDIPESGWYELWQEGSPPTWPRGILLDGEVVTRLMNSYDDDIVRPDGKGRTQIKEVNLYLTKGGHTLRIQRLSFPGWLPSAWELRPSGDDPGGCIRAWADGSHMVQTGSSLPVMFLGGTSVPTSYELYLYNEADGSEIPAGEVSFDAVKAPVEKTVEVTFPSEGFYSLRAKSGGKALRPSDLKTGFFAVGDVPTDRRRVIDEPFRFAGMFVNGLILQQDKPLPVWGWAPPGDTVTVTIGKQKQSTVAGSDGTWKITFEPMHADGKTYELTATTSSGKSIACEDVLIGEVWLASGQSNMGGVVTRSTDIQEWVERGDYPDARFLGLLEYISPNGESLVKGWRWVDAVFNGDPNAQRTRGWQPIQYAFATDLYRALNVPIGVLSFARGGTNISTWTSLDVHREVPSFNAMLEGHQQDMDEYVHERLYLTKYAEQLAKWREKAEKARSEGTEVPKMPAMRTIVSLINAPALNYESLTEPIAPFAARGFIWYQGEADTSMGAAYMERFPAMIKNWRELWGDPDMPFLYVQVAYSKGDPYEGPVVETTIPEVKDVQLKSLSVPHTAMVVTDDLMKPGDNVHYPNKLPVGERLALAALATVYGRDMEYSGPIYTHHKVEGNSIRLYFDHADGLAVKGDSLKNFSIAGKGRKWAWADARIEGDTVVVSSPEVSEPVAVRYSWAPDPRGSSLVNSAGLPTPVFRTDDWPLLTDGIVWIKRD